MHPKTILVGLISLGLLIFRKSELRFASQNLALAQFLDWQKYWTVSERQIQNIVKQNWIDLVRYGCSTT